MRYASVDATGADLGDQEVGQGRGERAERARPGRDERCHDALRSQSTTWSTTFPRTSRHSGLASLLAARVEAGDKCPFERRREDAGAVPVDGLETWLSATLGRQRADGEVGPGDHEDGSAGTGEATGA